MKWHIDSILYKLDNTPLEFKGGAYANYYELMDASFLNILLSYLIYLRQIINNVFAEILSRCTTVAFLESTIFLTKFVFYNLFIGVVQHGCVKWNKV